MGEPLRGAAARVDWAGVTHAPAAADARIACLVPSITELLFALDLRDAVVARTGFCVHPHDAVRAVPKVGGTKDPDVARLRDLAPTHVIVNVDENRREVVDEIARFVPHVIVTHPQQPDDNRRLYALVGGVFGRESAAAALAARYDAARAAVDAAAAGWSRERVLYLIWRKPWMTVRADTYVGTTLAAVGWDVVALADPRRYPALDDDADAWRDADRILLSTEPYAFTRRDVDALAALHAKPVHLVDGEWTSWYGPRAIDGLTALAGLRASVTAARASRP
jgi:ABC-type Fe3+-hydroxamate transport system substrate-binding protein